jgi:hypothetical protein
MACSVGFDAHVDCHIARGEADIEVTLDPLGGDIPSGRRGGAPAPRFADRGAGGRLAADEILERGARVVSRVALPEVPHGSRWTGLSRPGSWQAEMTEETVIVT